MEIFIRTVELLGVLAFSVTGVCDVIEKKLDLFGAIILGVTTSVGGGLLRDVILGVHPPIMFQTPIYALVAAVASTVLFLWMYWTKKDIHFLDGIVNVVDAVGLGLFVTIGCNFTAECGFTNGFVIVFAGSLTGIGGGVLRDILIGKIPKVLRKKIYAVAAIAGAVLFWVLTELHIGVPVSIAAGTALILVIRLLATHYQWNFPTIE